MSNYWKKKMDELEKETKKTPSQSYWDRKMAELEDEDIAPIKSVSTVKEEEDDGKLDFFQKSRLFDDGYDIGDITKTILGSIGDAGLNAVKGVGSLVEGIGDLGAYGVAGVADAIGKDSFADDLRRKTQVNAVDQIMKPAEDYLDKYSVLGRTSDAILQGVGQVGGILATGGLGAAAGLGTVGTTALTTGAMFASGMGSGMSEAYQDNATDEQALTYGAISGAADALSELIFGGLGKGVNALGLSKGLSSADDMLAKQVSKLFKNQIAKNFAEFGIKASAEGVEEVLAGIAQAWGKWKTYKSDEEFQDILKDENLLEQFVVGMAASGFSQAYGVNIANKTGTDFITGYTKNEQSVIDREIENRIAEQEKDGRKLTAKEKSAIEAQVQKDLEKGYISTDLIEEVVGGDTYAIYKNRISQEDALQKEFDELNSKKLGDLTGVEATRKEDLRKMLENIKKKDTRTTLKKQLDSEVSAKIKGSRLAESYMEIERGKQDFVADYSKYEGTKHPEAARKTIESLLKVEVDGKKVNNTNRVHDFVDMVAKAAADTGLTFSFQSGKQVKAEFIEMKTKEITELEAIAEPTAEQTEKLNSLKDLLQKVESGKIKVNGSISNGSIVLNLDSPKVLNRTVGHEITHSLEKAKSYEYLKKSLFAYAKTEGIDIDSEINTRKLMYEGVANADPEAELVSDLVGDFLFNDTEYINKLSVENRNVFQRIYDEIKHLLKLATAGSKEARQLEQVKRNMEKAYREAENSRQSKEISDSDTKYSIRKEAPPKNTGVAYKVFFVKDGKLYPPMVANPGGADTPMGVWLNADMGTAAPPSKTGRAQVKAGGKGTQGGGGSLAFRPGWHLGDLPRASQFDRVNPETGKKELFPENFVWAEVEYAKDVDYQEEAMSYGYTDKGKFRHAYAGLPRLPENGYYRYRTNPKPDTVPWVITGAMKVNRLLSDAEVNAILEKNGVPPVHRQGGDVGLDKFGFNDDGTVKYSLTADSDGRQLSTEQQEFFKDSAIRDKDGNLMVLYHGTQNAFTVFDIGRSGENYDGWSEYGEGIYLTPEKKTAEYYGDNAGRGREVKLMEVYADIKKPFSTNDPVDFDISDLTQKYELTEFDERFMKKYGSRLIEFLNHHNESVRDYLASKGFDGVWETIDGDVYQVVAYAENQVKNVSNQNPTSDPDIRYSLSEAQSEYFKDSKVRDENGNLMVMYHGTPNGDFTVFKDGTYFTASKEYADRYQNPGASSIRTGKVASNPKTFEVYLNIKKPFDIADAEARSIYINDYIKGGNAMGINPYLSDAEYAKINTIDWTEGEDLRDFLIENEYDYDGLVLDEGGTGGYGDEVQNRGKAYVVFSPEQVKNIDNKNPTSDPDIRFSLSEAVEETKDLLAVHNLRGSELIKSLELGGLPMPSIAVLKANAVHDEYGEVSLILRKDAIDPEANSDNKVYGGDAWTPTYPRIEYKPRKSVEDRISDKYYDLARRIGYDEVRPLYSYVTDLERQLNNNRGEAAILEYLYEDTDMMQVYLQDVGKGKIQPVEKETVTKISEVEAEMNQFLLDALGKDMIAGFATPAGENPRTHRTAFIEEHRAEIETAYKRLCMEVYNFTEEQADNVVENSGDRHLMKILRDVLLYSKNNGITVKTETDYAATRKKILEAASDGYKEWVDSLFKGVEEKSGIRNNVDYWTRSGNRRSWDALHWENTLENVVKTMKADRETGGGSMSPFTDLFGESHKKYGSIAEIKADSDRLGKIDQEEYEKIKDSFSKRFAAIANSIKDPGERNPFIAADTAAEQITDAVRNRKTKSGILTYLRKYNSRATMQTVDDVLALVSDIANMPTGYFEAKPRRAVGFEEVGVFVIPYDADVKLKQELLNRGYSIAEYDPKVEGDRQRVVNQFEEYKFSLMDASEGFTPVGRNEIYSRDLLKTVPAQEEIAPVSENATTEASNATPNATNATPNASLPTSNATSVLPNAAAEESPVVEDLFPDDLAPAQRELENLMAEQDELRQALETAVSVGDYAQVSSLTADYESVTARIREIQAQEDERFNTLGDADMPPEMDAPYPGEPSEPADPFAERDIVEVGKRSVKAYQYENPEVKPFFQEAAYGMLGDLHNGTKGEKIFNEDVYYRSGGEEGWMGTKRNTTADIAELLDTWHYTYAEIEEGLNDIIEDHGKENNAVSKRIEFMLDDRLRNGYTGVWGEPMPANQEYINLLKEKQVTEYSEEAFKQFMANADQYAPTMEEYYAPMLNSVPGKPQNVPVYSMADGQQTYIPSKATYDAVPGTADDIAPLYDTTARKGVPEGQQAFLPDAGVPKRITRKELHANIISNINARFAEKGFDLDTVLKKAKNLSTFATVDNIPQRVMEKALGYKEGGILADFTVNKVAQHETDGIKWLNSFTDRKNGMLAQISKRYNIKPGSKESAAAQMYAEGFYVGENNDIIKYGDRELALDFPDPVKQAQIKGLARDPRIRKIYDDTLKAINESRTRNAYPEIPRLDNYFLHFRAMNDTFSRLGLPFNPNDIRAKDLPTDLNGVTADLKPGQPFFASAMHREGKRTSFDLLGGLEQYLTSAKNQIYHIDDIQALRALRNYIADAYGQAHGLENLDELSQEAQFEQIKKVYDSHLSTFAKFLHEEANVLAGKTALIDRGLEGIIGRRGMTFLDTVNRQVGANMVGYNVSSSLTNFLAPVQAFAKSNKAAFLKGFAQTVSNRINSLNGNGDGFAENSPVMIRRKGAERFHRTFWQKMSDPGYVLMSAVDDVSTELIARAKYNELTFKGMDSQQAHIETDKWVSRLMGDRSLGQQPQLYNSKMLGIFTKFQLEVRNQLDSQFYDTIQEAKVSNEAIQNGLARNAKTAAKVASTFVQLAIGQHLFGKVFESVAGYNPAFDIISAIIKAFGWDDDEEDEDTVLDNLEQGFFELMEDMPYYSIFSGGRIPIESALPIEELIKGKDQYGNDKSRWKTLGEAAPYYFLPGGYGQIKKTVAGLGMFSEDHPIAGSYTDSGNLRFPVEDTLANRGQAALFGQYASGNARDYFDNERSALKEKQIQEFIDVGLSIQDYWKYRDGLSGLSKLEDKIDYINGLGLTTAQKNVLVNNLTDRKEAIDMEDYDQYGSLDEFDYATKNPEKYALFEDIGINYNTYKNAGEDAKKAYDWALENPEKYPMSKAIAGDVVEYRRYASDLNDLKADKDADGKSISGSRKEKVLDYINGLDIDYGAKLILFKSEYKSDNESNYQILDYLNSRSDLSYEEVVTILRSLDFTVMEDGTVYWD